MIVLGVRNWVISCSVFFGACALLILWKTSKPPAPPEPCKEVYGYVNAGCDVECPPGARLETAADRNGSPTYRCVCDHADGGR